MSVVLEARRSEVTRAAELLVRECDKHAVPESVVHDMRLVVDELLASDVDDWVLKPDV